MDQNSQNIVWINNLAYLNFDAIFEFLGQFTIRYISSGVSHSDGSCVLGRIHSDVSSNIAKNVYHIVTDNFVNLLHISYA